MFQAIGRADRATLRTLADTFFDAGDDPAALLCLDHVFSSTPSLQHLPLRQIRETHTFFLDYIRQLTRLLRDESLAEGAHRQRLFGFKVLGETRYLVPNRTFLYEQLINQLGSSGPSVDGYECGSDELRRATSDIIKSRIRDRSKTQNSACRDIHGFSPCLWLLVQKECNPQKQGSCTFQHVQPEQLTVDWYRSRLYLILLQFQILDAAGYYDLDVEK